MQFRHFDHRNNIYHKNTIQTMFAAITALANDKVISSATESCGFRGHSRLGHGVHKMHGDELFKKNEISWKDLYLNEFWTTLCS